MKKFSLFTSILFVFSTLILAQVPTSPILIEPPNEASVVSTTTTLSWDAVSGADCYYIYITTDTLISPPAPYCMKTSNSYDIPSGTLNQDAKYFWRVQAHNSSGWGPPSEYFYFTTVCSTLEGSIVNLQEHVTAISNENRLNNIQANILIFRLDKAIDFFEQERIFQGYINIIIFKIRVFSLRISGMITQSDYNSLQYSADGVIDLIETVGPQGFTKNFVIPEEFSLKQNYPNPFNPVTTIEYSIPENSYVTVKVYDLLGREIAVIVDKYQQQGTYITKWDASKFSSGVYIYKLTAGSRSESKKMVLSK